MLNRRTAWVKAAAMAASLLLALSLVACGSPEKKQTSADSESSSASSSSAAAVSSNTKAAAEQPEPELIEVNETIEDEEMGFTIDFKQAIVDLPFDNPDLWYNGYRTGVAVEVEMTNNSELSTFLYGTDLCLLVNGKEVHDVGNSGVGAFQTYADENGLVAFPINGVSRGETITGWIFYYFETGSGDNELALRYKRDETKVTVLGAGSDYTIPAETVDIDFYPPAA